MFIEQSERAKQLDSEQPLSEKLVRLLIPVALLISKAPEITSEFTTEEGRRMLRKYGFTMEGLKGKVRMSNEADELIQGYLSGHENNVVCHPREEDFQHLLDELGELRQVTDQVIDSAIEAYEAEKQIVEPRLETK